MAPLFVNETITVIQNTRLLRKIYTYFISRILKTPGSENLTLAIHCHFNTRYINNVAATITKMTKLL